jgi:drug/metabolite transporter superfamily protein YnfA
LLPLLWGYTRKRPAHMAWLGAALAVVGSAIILVR